MMTKKYRAPGAWVVVALFAAAILPVSGAESTTMPLHTFHSGGPGDPKWTILELRVTEEGAIPSIFYETPAARCPMVWGTTFWAGSLADAEIYGGLTFSFHSGRNGVDVYGDTPLFGIKRTTFQDDGREHCLFLNMTVDHEELPLGTVYVVHMTAGVPFEGTATLRIMGSGVSIVNMTSGTRTFYRNDTEMAGGVSVAALGPPWCGAIEHPCQPGHLNQGGGYGAVLQVDREWPIVFRNHPFYEFTHHGGAKVSNASVLWPDGRVQWEELALVEAGGINVHGGGMGVGKIGAPKGSYSFRIHASADVAPPTTPLGGPPGWFFAGADLKFPGE